MTYSSKKNLSRPCPSLDKRFFFSARDEAKSSHSTLHTSHCTLRTPNFKLHTPHFTLHTPHFTLHSPHFTLLTSHCFLHTPNLTLQSGLPLPRVTCAPGFVDTNLTLEHKTTKVESVRKKKPYRRMSRVQNLFLQKSQGFTTYAFFFVCFFFEIALNFHNTFVGPCSHVGW